MSGRYGCRRSGRKVLHIGSKVASQFATDPISPMLTARPAPGDLEGLGLVRKASAGPALPPHLQHLAAQGEDEEVGVAVTATSAGPALPPHLQHLAAQGEDEEDHATDPPSKRSKLE